MALNHKIVEKIKSRTAGDETLQEQLLTLLAEVEQDKQAKRLIDKIVSKL